MYRLLLVLLTSFLLQEIAAKGDPCAQSKKNAVKNYVFRFYPDLRSLSFGSLTGWSGGGGSPQTIPPTSSNPFAGRQFGGGDRNRIYGTRAYGSGYPYGASNTSSIAGRAFPYGTWPISFGSYLGGQEVIGSNVDVMRPGGPLVTVQVGSTDTGKWPGLSKDEVYTMVGDRDSVQFMMQDLAWWCHATPQWPTPFNASNPSVKPEQVIQYYRASSFALAYPYYNNTFAHGDVSTSFTFAQSTALPSNISSSSFLHCVNETIAVAIPIVDAYAAPKKKLAPGVVAGIVLGVFGGFLLLYVIIAGLPRLLRKY